MDTAITILAKQLNASVFILLVILVVAFVLTFKISGWISNFKNSKEKIDSFETATREFIATSSEKFAELTTKVDLIYQHVNPNIAVRSHGPMMLTDIGKKMQKDMNAQLIFERIRESEKVKILRAHHEKNAYDIQMACIEWAKKNSASLLTAEELEKVKNLAFENGILLEDVLAILGIMMRDTILKELDIPVSDIDRHDPN